MKKRILKVYGTTHYFDSAGHQCRAVVAAQNGRDAAKALGHTYYSFRQYCSETGNKRELLSAYNAGEGNVVIMRRE